MKKLEMKINLKIMLFLGLIDILKIDKKYII